MKTKKVWSGLIGAVLSFGAAFAGVGCLVSAFEFGVDMKTMAAVIFLCAVVAAVCFSVKFGALLLAAVCIFLYVRTMMKPLRQLTAASRQMAEGMFDARVEVTRPSPEVAELAATFNMMADRLSETEESRREFVANVSHELRSPITSISGFVQGMEDGTIPSEEHPKYLASVLTETRRLSKLIGDLLVLSRLEKKDAALNMSNFDICEMMRRAIIRRMNDFDEKQLELNCDFQDESLPVYADSDRIEQVIVNLLDNAIKFTPAGGNITLRCVADGDLCRVTVQDDGIGITPEDRAKVFDRFFTADRAHTAVFPEPTSP